MPNDTLDKIITQFPEVKIGFESISDSEERIKIVTVVVIMILSKGNPTSKEYKYVRTIFEDIWGDIENKFKEVDTRIKSVDNVEDENKFLIDTFEYISKMDYIIRIEMLLTIMNLAFINGSADENQLNFFEFVIKYMNISDEDSTKLVSKWNEN
jgi:hypothetical protein